MKDKMIWSYFLELSLHIGADENTVQSAWYLPPQYTECNNADIEVWDETVKFIAERKFNACVIDVGDAVQYESHPEISAPDAWSKDFLKSKLEQMRALGIEPLPKLNFSMCHTTWLKEYRRRVSTPEFYRVCSELIAEVCEVFGSPRLFHLGMDEETAWDQSARGICIVRGEKLWWHDLFFLFSECEKHGARPWVWADYYWTHPDLFEKNMPKSVLQSNWQYESFRDYDDTFGYKRMPRINAYERLDKLGYDQVPGCSTWYTNTNPYETLAHGKAKLSKEKLKGYLTIPWAYGINRETEYSLKNDAHRLYVARQKLYPETL